MLNNANKRKIPFLSIALVLIILVIKANVIFASPDGLLNWYNSDDAFYYFKVAQNITEGKGISFDGISRTNGFHPLWLLICTPVFALTRLDVFLPLRLLAALSIALNIGTSLLILQLVKRVFDKEAAFFIALLWALSPDIHKITTEQGMESGLATFFILLLLFLIARAEGKSRLKDKEIYMISIAAMLTVFSRLDSIFLVVLLGFWLVFRKSKNIRYLLFFDLFLGFTSVLISYFGRLGFGFSFLPSSNAALLMVLTVSVLRPIIHYFLGLYHIDWRKSKARIAARGLVAVTVTGVCTAICMQAYQITGLIQSYPRSTLIFDWAISLIAVIATRLLIHHYMSVEKTSPPANPISQLKNQFSTWLYTGLKYFIPLAGALTLYLVWNTIAFGSPMPISGRIKQWWGSIPTFYGTPVSSFGQVFGLPDGLNERPWMVLVALPYTILFEIFTILGLNDAEMVTVIAGILGISFVLLFLLGTIANFHNFRKASNYFALLPLGTASFIQIYYYAVTNYVHSRNWYWIGEIICITLVFGVLLGSYYRWLRSRRKPKIWLNFTRIFLTAFIFLGFIRYFPLSRFSRTGDNPALADVEMIAQLTEENAVIGMTGGGITAYFLRNRTVVNLDGLMNSQAYFEGLQKCDLDGYLDNTGMDYLFGNEYLLTESMPYRCIFQGRLDEIARLNEGTLFSLMQ